MRRPDFVRLNAFDNISAGAFSFSIGSSALMLPALRATIVFCGINGYIITPPEYNNSVPPSDKLNLGDLSSE